MKTMNHLRESKFSGVKVGFLLLGVLTAIGCSSNKTGSLDRSVDDRERDGSVIGTGQPSSLGQNQNQADIRVDTQGRLDTTVRQDQQNQKDVQAALNNADRDLRNEDDDTIRSQPSSLNQNKADQDANQHAADNSGRNKRDTADGPPTPENQGQDETDVNITQKIRQQIVEDNSLSTNGKNVKIVTINRVVTLRGPVATSQERESIANKAKQVAGVQKVENQLEVTNTNK